MNRLFFCLLLALVVGCSHDAPVVELPEPDIPGIPDSESQPDSVYVLHDNYYYMPYPEKVYLTSCDDEYVIAFCISDKDEVLDYVLTHGYVILQGPFEFHPGYMNENFPEEWSSHVLLWIKGDGNVNEIPGIMYSTKLYIYKDQYEIEKRLYVTTRLFVKWENEEMLKLALKYAEELNLILEIISPNAQVAFMCTDKSAGNPVEISNWFCEVGGFPNARPFTFEPYNGYD